MNNYIRPLSHYLNKNNKNILTDNNKNVLLQQSPKISSRKFRVFKTEENKNKSNKYVKNNLFSLNDINDKVTNKRGTDFPDSFKRYNYNELKKIITSSNENKINNKKEEKIEENKQNNNNNNKNKNNNNNNNNKNKDYKRPNSAKNLNKKKLKINIENNNIKENNKKNNENNNNNNKDIKIIYNSNKKADELLIKYMINKKADKYLPKNYNYYNTCLNNPILYNEMKNEQILKIAPKYKILNYNNIKNKINYSDIFFVKKENNINNKTFNNTNNKYLQSNIFNTKNLTNYDIEKSSEKYLFNKTNLQKYSKISDSKSDFVPYKINNVNQINSNNLTNEKYNIIAPNIKNYLDICKNDVKSNKKIKGLSEFYDKTRKTNCNINEDYQKAFENNKFTFRKVHQMCGDYIESYNVSKSLVNHPFKNK